MHCTSYCLFLVVLTTSIFLYKFINVDLISICEIDKCPYCFGTDFCNEFLGNQFVFSNSLRNIFANYISVKNVFYVFYKNHSVVLKKLGHDSELNEMVTFSDTNTDYVVKIIELLTPNASVFRHFKLCSNTTISKFLKHVNRLNTNNSQVTFFKNIWTILQINVEPVLLQILKKEDDWPVPHYYGACGRVIVESNCGINLNSFSNKPWNVRAYLALQILQAAQNFTEKHPDFRFYLTDISPDNIAVDLDLKVSFVDLENAIVADKNSEGADFQVHLSQNFNDSNDGSFSYVEEEICESSLSDHNYYAVCKLLLSRRAPWPMMEGGLLHSPPNHILIKYFRLFELVEICAFNLQQRGCFDVIESIIGNLKIIVIEMMQ